MQRHFAVRLLLVSLCVAGSARASHAQSAAPASSDAAGWRTTVYPILAWVPINIAADVNVPPISGGGGGESASIVDTRLTGAFFAGAAVSNRVWRFEGYGLWARFGGERPNTPFLDVDVDLLYGSGKVGRRIAPDLYVTGGVRRAAIDYDISLGSLPHLTRKPGVWDPIVGLGWHRERAKVEWHATFDGGGFGVGADVDLGASLSVDWKPIPHFGFTGGYNLLYLKVSDTVASRDLTLKMTLHGPTVGIGFYF